MPALKSSSHAIPGEYGYAENVALGDLAEKMEVAPTYRLLERRTGTSTPAGREENCAGSNGSNSCDRNSAGR